MSRLQEARLASDDAVVKYPLSDWSHRTSTNEVRVQVLGEKFGGEGH